MDEKRMNELLSDEAFMRGLFDLESPEEVQEVLRRRGVSLSLEEVIVLRDIFMKLLEKAQENGGELSMDDLDAVAGGFGPTATAAQVAIATVFYNSHLIIPVLTGAAAAAAAFFTRGRW